MACPSCPDHSPEPLGPGRVIRNMLGWSQLEKTVRSGVWLFRGALRGENLFSSFCAAGDWVKKLSYHTAWSVPCDFSCTCSYAYGPGPAIGPHTGKRCWPLLAGVWRAIAPLMKPWCAEGDVPTAANLNLYRGWKSCVSWHCDDEPLFGKCGDVKLIVSVSFGSSALFRWRRQSCSDGDAGSCWLGHGDILVMDGQCLQLLPQQQHQQQHNNTTTQQQQHRAADWCAVLASASRFVEGYRIAPLMKPWCAEEEVPTAANLNLCRVWNSCVGWHRDDEPLFGECGEAKLTVSVSFGSFTLFKWKGQSCPDDEAHLCWLGHGDILVMDGQCQDEFLHCASPAGRDLERINVTFRWIKQHASSCPFLKAGVACCLPTCAQGSSVPNKGNLGFGLFLAFGFLLCVLCIWGVPVFLASLLCTRLGLLRCASCWTRPLGGGRWGHYLCNLWEEHLKVHKTPHKYFEDFLGNYIWKLYMPALVGRPSLHGYDACMVYSVKGALR